MKYLLLNGTSTTNINTYIKDLLFLNFKLLPSELPFNNELGLSRYILEDSELDFMDKTRSSISELIKKINSRYGITLTLVNLNLLGDSIHVDIRLNDNNVEEYIFPILK